MSSGVKERQKIYQAVISSPGMSDKCKIGIHLSRQTIFVLCRIIETGLKNETGDNEWVSLLSKEAQEELLTVVPEFLRKSALTEFYENLKSF